MADTKKDQGSALVKWIVRIVAWTVILLGVALFIRLVIVPAHKQATAQQRVQKSVAAKSSDQSADESFVLRPGQGKLITSNYRRVNCKVTGPCLVRERNGAWFGEWKKDGPGRQTKFDFSAAKEIEYWVPNNFPGPVAIVARR
jgi:hypothetical protein